MMRKLTTATTLARTMLSGSIQHAKPDLDRRLEPREVALHGQRVGVKELR